jgi:hypothetical protein
MSNTISDAGKNRIAEVLRHDLFIEAVKLHRELTGSDLLAAKSSVERIQTSLGITTPRLSRSQELAEPALIIAVTLAIISIAWSLPSSAAYTLTLRRTSSLPTVAVAQSAGGGTQKRQNLPLDTLLPVIKL